MTDMNELIMKTDRRGRLRYTADQKQALVAYEASGLSGPRFAALHGVNYQTLVSWLRKRRREDPDHPALRSGKPARPEAKNFVESIHTCVCYLCPSRQFRRTPIR